MSRRKFAMKESRASGSTKRLVEKIAAQGRRAVRRQFVAAERAKLEGGSHEQ